MVAWHKVSGAGANLANPWDLSYAEYDGVWPTFPVSAQDNSPTDVFFKPDGTKMYVTGDSGNDVNEYDLSTAWVVSSASYVQNFSVSAQDTNPTGVFFKPDGTKMYVIGRSSDSVYEYDLSTAWDISSASYLQGFSVATQETIPNGMFFKPDGTKMYVIGESGDDINEYNLSTAWDISSASYLQLFDVSAQSAAPDGVFFRADGEKFYVVDGRNEELYEYDLSTPWDVSTASYLQLLDVSVIGGQTDVQGVFFKPDGLKMFIVDDGSRTVFEFTLSSAWDISTATLDYGDGYLDVSSENTSPQALSFKPDGTKMYMLGINELNEYDLSTPWDITSASYLQNLSLSAQATACYGLFFKPDGTKFWVAQSTSDSILEYTLSTAWDISSASNTQNYSVASQSTAPYGVFFKPDGTKMYVISTVPTDVVLEYNLNTAWTFAGGVSYVRLFNVSTQEASPQDLFFKPDGTKMYVVGSSGDDVNEYDLSTAWNISTASFLQNFSVSAQDLTPTGLFFKSDGKKMFILGRSGDAIYGYVF